MIYFLKRRYSQLARLRCALPCQLRVICNEPEMKGMKIKQTTFYALQILKRIHLEDKDIVTSILIADRENLSQGVVLKLLRTMVDTKILYAHQGRDAISGGFSMMKSVDEITLMEIVDVMEGVDICENLDEEKREKEAILFHKCCQINEYLRNEFSRYTIRDLFDL